MTDKFKQLARKFNVKEEKLFAAIFTFLVVAIAFIDSNFFHNEIFKILAIADIGIFLVIVFVVMMMAGIMVVRSLFFVAASLSLVVYLSEKYCSLPKELHTGDASLKTLIIVSLLLVMYDFFQSMLVSLKNYFDKINKSKINENNKLNRYDVFIVSLFVAFVFVFIVYIFNVVAPIFKDICIYK